MSEVNVTGLSDLQKFLDQVPVKVEKNVLRGALRAGMKVVQPVAQANIHSVSGELAAGLKIGTRTRGATVTAYLHTTGPHAWLGRFVEWGTKPHFIESKGGALFFGGLLRRFARHPGAAPHPFLRPALDSQAQAAVIAAAEYMKARLAQKNGLDTSDVRIEGDEP